MKEFSFNAVLGLIAAGFFVAAPSLGHAATMPCSATVAGKVTGSSGCEFNTNIDNDSPEEQFLAGNWFGSMDWQQIAKDDSPVDGTIDLTTTDPSGLSITSNGTDALPVAGNWSITGYDPSRDYMLVLKSANSADPAGLVSFLLNAASGTYETVFSHARNGQYQNLSHISLWSKAPAAVPLPAAGVLLLIGVGGLAAMKRRQRA